MCEDFVRRMLTKDETKRINANEVRFVNIHCRPVILVSRLVREVRNPWSVRVRLGMGSQQVFVSSFFSFCCEVKFGGNSLECDVGVEGFPAAHILFWVT